MKWNVGTKIGAGFGIALVIFVIAGIVSHRSLTELTDAAKWREHTYRVLTELAMLPRLLKQAESSTRGFALTGDENYLQTRPDERTVGGVLQDLRELTKDNALQ